MELVEVLVDKYGPMMNYREIAEVTKETERGVRQRTKRQGFPFGEPRRYGKTYLFKTNDVARYLET